MNTLDSLPKDRLPIQPENLPPIFLDANGELIKEYNHEA